MKRKPPKQREEPLGKPGRIDQWPADYPSLDEIAEEVYFRGSGKHKTYPAPNGEWVPIARGRIARCAKYSEGEWHELTTVLKEAIRSGVVQVDSGSRFPSRAWAYVNGVLHEARRTNMELGEYHGFPLDHESPRPIDRFNRLKDAPRVTIATD